MVGMGPADGCQAPAVLCVRPIGCSAPRRNFDEGVGFGILGDVCRRDGTRQFGMLMTRAAAGLLALSLLLGGCGDSSTTSSTLAEEEVSFLQGMVPHHAQAVDMARLVPDRTAHPDELGELADMIIATQADEISLMNDLLVAAGEDAVEPSDAGGMDGMDMSGMSGMMSSSEMSDLADSDGEVFDGLFLEMMIAHHAGAIESAEDVLGADGLTADVADLAEEIIDAQEAEIAQMQTWQEDWSV